MGSHFNQALYWAQAPAAQVKKAALQARFKKLAETLAANEARIDAELIAAQGKACGYQRLLFARCGRVRR